MYIIINNFHTQVLLNKILRCFFYYIEYYVLGYTSKKRNLLGNYRIKKSQKSLFLFNKEDLSLRSTEL